MRSRGGRAPGVGFVLLALLLLCATGCTQQPFEHADVLAKVVALLVARRAWKLVGDEPERQHDRLRATFAVSRGRVAFGLSAGWTAERLADWLAAQLDQVEAFLQARVALLLDPAADREPRHLRLDDEAKVLDTTPPNIARLRAGRLRRERLAAVRAIIWRSAGVHDYLWTAELRLREALLDELVDRRLHAVELMHCRISSAAGLLGGEEHAPAALNVAAGGEWLDGFRVRAVEYGVITSTPAITAAIAAAGTDPQGSWGDSANGLAFFDTSGWNIRYPDDIKDAWAPVPPENYDRVLAARTADNIARLVSARRDFRARCLLPCDHAACAVELAALRLGKLRAPGGAAALDAVLAREGYVFTGSITTGAARDGGRLMAEGPKGTYFNNLDLSAAELQVGDTLTFFNSPIYRLISGGLYRFEQSLVAGLDCDPRLSGVGQDEWGPKLWLEGHGIARSRYDRFGAGMVNELNRLLGGQQLQALAATQQGMSELQIGGRGPVRLVRWNPYPEDNLEPAPWWIRIGRDEARAQGYDPPEAVLADLAPAIGVVLIPDRPKPPHFADTVAYFPLWEPDVALRPGSASPWHTYLLRRREGPIAGLATKLIQVKADALVPGLFVHRDRKTGSPRALRVVRPDPRTSEEQAHG